MNAKAVTRVHVARAQRSASTPAPASHPLERVLLVAVVGLWLAMNAPFFSAYYKVVSSASSTFSECTVCLGLAWILLVSFFASYHITSFTLSLLVRVLGSAPPCSYASQPAVAVLCTCMNDLKECTLRACVSQDYPDFTVFLLDDSTTPGERERVDALAAQVSPRIRVLRRDDRGGFKAGNLNHALLVLDGHYKYLSVVDSDEILPPEFLRETIGILEANPCVGFVQAAHDLYAETEFARFISDGAGLHWDYFLPARNWAGFMYCYGHGVMFRTEAALAVGGFPEVVSEDVAIAARLRMAGYRGFFAHHVRCREEAPGSYTSYRRRNRKVVSGTLEFLLKQYGQFFRSPHVSLTEKCDLLIASSVIYLPVAFLGFIISFHLALPLMLGGTWNPMTNLSLAVRDASAAFQQLSSKGFAAFLVLTVLAPAVYSLPNAIRHPIRTARHIMRSSTLHLSMCVQTAFETARTVVTRRFVFVATADSLERDTGQLPRWLEVAFAAVCLVLAAIWGSLPLAAIVVSLFLVDLLHRGHLRGRLTRVLAVAPLVLAIVGIVSTPTLAVCGAGILATSLLAQP